MYAEKTSGGILNTSIRKTSFLPLRDAVLCGDCNFVSADEEGVCPVCRGRSLTNLADQLRHAQQISAQHMADGNARLGIRGVLHFLGFRRKHDSGFAFSQR
jgi:hypothetical protein